jgi:hypothetical protein
MVGQDAVQEPRCECATVCYLRAALRRRRCITRKAIKLAARKSPVAVGYFYELAHPTAGLRGDQRHALMVREFAAYEARFSATMRPIEAAAYKGDVKKFRAIYMDFSYDARDANPLYFYYYCVINKR